MSITFHYQAPFKIPKAKFLKHFLNQVAIGEGHSIKSLSVIITTDDFLLGLNQRFLSHDYYTDILTFNLANPGDPFIQAELYISIERVKENASTNHVTVLHELRRIMIHGLLHLCNYTDKTVPAQSIMTEREDYYLHLFSTVPRGTIISN